MTEAETKWIETATLRVLRGIQTRMSSPAFKETLDCLAANRQGDYIKTLYNPGLKTNLPKFLTRLYEKRLPTPKYTTETIADDDEDEEDPPANN